MDGIQDTDELYRLDPAVAEDARKQAELDAKRLEIGSMEDDTTPGGQSTSKAVNGTAEHVEAAVR